LQILEYSSFEWFIKHMSDKLNQLEHEVLYLALCAVQQLSIP
jgi:hypothetical protein